MKRWVFLAGGLLIAGATCVVVGQPAPGNGGAGGVAPAAGRAAPAGGGGRAGFGGGGAFGRGRGFQPGPPAPVPAEVAIPHPTSEELAQINADLKHFVETDMSPDKDMLKKYESLIEIPMPRLNPAIMPIGGGVRGPRHQAFVDIANSGKFDILFEGDSITDWWQQNPPNGGRDVLKKYFGDVEVANFAVAGDTTQGLLWGLQNGEGQGHKPKAVMLMIGTNNTGGNSGPEIAEGVGADVLELRKDFPDAKILLLAIFPRGAGPSDPNRIKNEEANKIIARLDDHQHVFFMNINSKFLDDKGALVGFRGDHLHPNQEGYDIWGAAVADTLKGWLK